MVALGKGKKVRFFLITKKSTNKLKKWNKTRNNGGIRKKRNRFNKLNTHTYTRAHLHTYSFGETNKARLEAIDSQTKYWPTCWYVRFSLIITLISGTKCYMAAWKAHNLEVDHMKRHSSSITYSIYAIQSIQYIERYS